MPDVIVIGGGIAGLAAAWTAGRAGRSALVLETAGHAGGPVTGHRLAGLELDAGTESFATRGGRVAPLLAELGLGDAIVAPNPAGAWAGFAEPDASGAPRLAVCPLPRTGMLGIPGDLDAPELLTAIGPDGVARARRDLALPATVTGAAAGEPVLLGPLVRARMGEAVVRRLVAPVAGGIYSGDPDRMPVAAVAPGLLAELDRTGSLSAAVARLQAQRAPGSAVRGLAGGMHTLTDRLVAVIAEQGGTVRTHARVVALARDASGWSVEVAGPAGRERLHAPQVVLATTARPALRLLADAGARDLRDVTWPEPAHIALVTLVVDDARLDAQPRGTGMLVTPDVPGVAAKAMTHATAKWAWAAEAARDPARGGRSGRHVLRLSYGRAGQPADPDDEALVARGLADASALTGLDLDPARVAGAVVHRWDNVQPSLDADRLREAVHAFAAACGDLAVVGSWLSGTGLASVLPDAVDRAERLVAAPAGRRVAPGADGGAPDADRATPGVGRGVPGADRGEGEEHR